MSCRSIVTVAIACVVVGGWSIESFASHPRLLLTAEDVKQIKATLDQSPSFERAIQQTRLKIDAYFKTPPDVPWPVDAGGGYSHEQHKRNGIKIREAGVVYQLTGELRYAEHAKSLLLAYAEIYPELTEHPQRKEQTPGRLFWQSLNESVWLVYAIQGYDAIYDVLSEQQRNHIETNLLRLMADFLSEGSPQTFDRIHNHGTWAVAAVGMTGYVLDDRDYVEKALYGLQRDGSAGFLQQLDSLISPDGYYTEGPYYQRYALMPVVVFARSIHANDPDLKIFQYRDGLIVKAIYACLELAYGGLFFPINDAIKEKGIGTVELRYGVTIAYALTDDARLLSVAESQGSLELTGDGFKAALAIDHGSTLPFYNQSVLFRDGSDGTQGALAVLRNGKGPRHQALVFKATAQGMGHGHFDKLTWLFYDNNSEIITDYGAARFLNIEPKNGGRYLPENTTWAKQTIAHNTLVVDETSHFNGDLEIAEEVHPQVLYFHSGETVHVVAAKIEQAYEDVTFNRTMILLDRLFTPDELIIDILKVKSPAFHQYDLPLHFKGQIIDASPSLNGMVGELKPLGSTNGYQHLWLRAQTNTPKSQVSSLTWLTDNRFYTFSSLANEPMDLLVTELGANDPYLNLRHEQAIILRVKGVSDHTFISTLEVHGVYNATEEFTVGSEGFLVSITHYPLFDNDLFEFELRDGTRRYLTLSYNPDPDCNYLIVTEKQKFAWNGYYGLFDEKERIHN